MKCSKCGQETIILVLPRGLCPQCKKKEENKPPRNWEDIKKRDKQYYQRFKYYYSKEEQEKAKVRRRARAIPLAECCEFCGDRENLMRHHPDYNEPLIFVTCCASCHRWIHESIDAQQKPKINIIQHTEKNK